MPLYTLWVTGTATEIVIDAIHCTGADLLIASVSLALAVVIFGGRAWPGRRYLVVAIAATVFGIVYTGFSEWVNTDIRGTWAYRDIMPQLPVLGTGLTPLLQWLLIAPLGLWFAYRQTMKPARE
ncbi:MAG: hypothetical protein ACNA7J_09890 [Wenzhouxiangella sp.]